MKHRVFPTPQSLLLGDASVELTLSWCSDMSLWRTDPVANHLNVFVFYIKKTSGRPWSSQGPVGVALAVEA